MHASPSMSSANLKFVSCLAPILIVPTCPFNAFVMIRSKTALNNMGIVGTLVSLQHVS